MNCSDEYGLTPLILAGWRGKSKAAAALLESGADVGRTARGGGGVTAAEAASAAGHAGLAGMLRAAEDRVGASVASLTVDDDVREDKTGFERGESQRIVADAVATQTLVDPAMDHPGANYSFIVDDAIPEDVLSRLERTWEASTAEAAAAVETALGEESDELAEKLRVSDGSSDAVNDSTRDAARANAIAEGTDARSMERLRADTCATRAHFCDVRGWARSAVLAAARESGMPVRGVHPQFRILHYPNPGGVMAPHVDLSKVLDRVDSTWSADDRPVDAMNQMKPALQTTHTFLLYLRTC